MTGCFTAVPIWQQWVSEGYGAKYNAGKTTYTLSINIKLRWHSSLLVTLALCRIDDDVSRQYQPGTRCQETDVQSTLPACMELQQHSTK